MKTYRTSQVAAAVGVHPNTVRLYEELQMIPKPERQANGYRIFTDYHVEQCRLVRLAFKVEVVQNGLRNKIVKAIKASAAGNFPEAILLIQEYIEQVGRDKVAAEDAVVIVKELLAGEASFGNTYLKRKEVSDALGISMDSLRNWEMNGLLTVKRKSNGYRIYSEEDVRRLKIIRTLRGANYSLESILRLLGQLDQNPVTDIRAVLNTPRGSEDIVSVCDHLIASLTEAEENAGQMLSILLDMENRFA